MASFQDLLQFTQSRLHCNLHSCTKVCPYFLSTWHVPPSSQRLPSLIYTCIYKSHITLATRGQAVNNRQPRFLILIGANFTKIVFYHEYIGLSILGDAPRLSMKSRSAFTDAWLPRLPLLCVSMSSLEYLSRNSRSMGILAMIQPNMLQFVHALPNKEHIIKPFNINQVQKIVTHFCEVKLSPHLNK